MSGGFVLMFTNLIRWLISRRATRVNRTPACVFAGKKSDKCLLKIGLQKTTDFWVKLKKHHSCLRWMMRWICLLVVVILAAINQLVCWLFLRNKLVCKMSQFELVLSDNQFKTQRDSFYNDTKQRKQNQQMFHMFTWWMIHFLLID